jgi:hypothetical protein
MFNFESPYLLCFILLWKFNKWNRCMFMKLVSLNQVPIGKNKKKLTYQLWPLEWQTSCRFFQKVEKLIYCSVHLIVDSCLIKPCNEIQFLSHLLGHLQTCFNHPNHKKNYHFNQEICEYLMTKDYIPNKLFYKCNGHSK